MKKNSLLFLCILTFAFSLGHLPGHLPVLGAQMVLPQQNAQQAALLIPNVVYVGDPAVLVLPLPAAIANSEDIVLTPQSPGIPKDPDIDFHRVILERRVTGSRLLIEFTAFVPGYIQLPVIEIGGGHYSGLSVTINSVIDSRKPLELSGYASSLAMPGTALIIYGALAVFALILILLIWFILKGRTFIHIWIEKWKRLRLFTFIRNMERNLQKTLIKGGDKRVILDKISDTFREFLSVLTKINCRSMTAREFTALPEKLIYNGSFLKDFFSRCDRLRFSGEDVSLRDVSGLLVDLRLYIQKLFVAEKTAAVEPKVRGVSARAQNPAATGGAA